MMRLIATALVTLSTLLAGQSLATESIVEKNKINKVIPDLGGTSIILENTSISQITSLQLEIQIKHENPKDLLIVLTTPAGKPIVLPNDSGDWASELTIYVSSEDTLAALLGESAIGQWQLQVYDQKKHNTGMVESVFFVIAGNESSHTAQSPVSSFSPTREVTSTKCSDKWKEITDVRPLEQRYKPLVNLCGDQFRVKLREIISTNRNLGYSGARRIMFGELDNVNGTVCSVYSERCVKTKGIPPNNKMNCEHSWPQSKGATGIAKADLHHLYPTMSKANSMRSSYPFCEVESITKESYGSYLGKVNNKTCFQPIEFHRGDLARAMFYFSIRYKKKINTLQELFFRKWNLDDTPSEKEIKRNDEIERHQGNRNPFIDHPEFVYLLNDF